MGDANRSDFYESLNGTRTAIDFGHWVINFEHRMMRSGRQHSSPLYLKYDSEVLAMQF
jgi:hypothetical protein